MASTPSRCSEPSTTCLMTSGRLVTRPLGLRSTGIDVPPELGGDHDLAPVRGERLADQFLVGVGAVDLRGVEERDAAVHSGADQRDHLLPVGLVAVATGHAHATQPDRGDLQAVGAQGALVHGCAPVGRRKKAQLIGCHTETVVSRADRWETLAVPLQLSGRYGERSTDRTCSPSAYGVASGRSTTRGKEISTLAITEAAQKNHDELFPGHVSTLARPTPSSSSTSTTSPSTRCFATADLDTRTRLMVQLAVDDRLPGRAASTGSCSARRSPSGSRRSRSRRSSTTRCPMWAWPRSSTSCTPPTTS